MLGSLTFLPALLSLLGTATDRARIPFLGRRRAAARPSRLWGLVVRAVVRRPLALGGLAAVALLALATPLLSLHLENPDLHAFPNSVPVIRTAEAIEQAFPGGPEPAEVVVTGDNLSGTGVSHAITALHAQVAATHGAIREPITTELFGAGQPASDQVLVISVPLNGNATNATSVNALNTLDTRVLPATLGKVPGISYAVGGDTASNTDFDAQLDSRTPLVFAFVLGLAFLLLMVSFRSVAIPALSICLNLLSVGAAYGMMTWIFQDGHLQGLLGFSSYGGITPWLPLFMFVLLFGLSMDYHVFILSRIRELRLRGASATGGGHRRDHLERGRGDQRRRDHGGGVLDLRHAVGDRVQGVRRRDGGRRAHRRDRGPRRAAAGRAGAARRPGLGDARPAPVTGGRDPAVGGGTRVRSGKTEFDLG